MVPLNMCFVVVELFKTEPVPDFSFEIMKYILAWFLFCLPFRFANYKVIHSNLHILKLWDTI